MQICNSKLVCMEHPRKLERSARRQGKWVQISAANSAKHKSQQLVGVCLELRRQCDSVSIVNGDVDDPMCGCGRLWWRWWSWLWLWWLARLV